MSMFDQTPFEAMPLESLRECLREQLQLTRFHDLRLILADGTLLTEAHDLRPLCKLLKETKET